MNKKIFLCYYNKLVIKILEIILKYILRKEKRISIGLDR